MNLTVPCRAVASFTLLCHRTTRFVVTKQRSVSGGGAIGLCSQCTYVVSTHSTVVRHQCAPLKPVRTHNNPSPVLSIFVAVHTERMPPRKRKRSETDPTPDGSSDVHKRSRRTDTDPNDHTDSKHSVAAASLAALASEDGTGGSDTAASSADGTARARRATRARPPSVITGGDYVIDSEEETEVSIAVSSVGWSKRSIVAPPRTASIHNATAAASAAPGAGAGAGASPAPRASSSSSSSSSGAGASSSSTRPKPHYLMNGKEYIEAMNENRARLLAEAAAAAKVKEAEAEKRQERKVCAPPLPHTNRAHRPSLQRHCVDIVRVYNSRPLPLVIVLLRSMFRPSERRRMRSRTISSRGVVPATSSNRINHHHTVVSPTDHHGTIAMTMHRRLPALDHSLNSSSTMH